MYGEAIAVVDTGSSLLGVPKSYFAVLKNSIKDSLNGRNTINCTLDSAGNDNLCYINTGCKKIYSWFSDIQFQIQNKVFTMTP